MTPHMITRKRLRELSEAEAFYGAQVIRHDRLHLLGPIDWIDRVCTEGAPAEKLGPDLLSSDAPWSIAAVPIEPRFTIRKKAGRWHLTWYQGYFNDQVVFDETVTFEQVAAFTRDVHREIVASFMAAVS